MPIEIHIPNLGMLCLLINLTNEKRTMPSDLGPIESSNPSNVFVISIRPRIEIKSDLNYSLCFKCFALPTIDGMNNKFDRDKVCM